MPLMGRCRAGRQVGSRQLGIVLIEILAAALLLIVGLLGLASLRGAALQVAHAHQLRAEATQLAHEIVDAMRANRTAAIRGDYDITSCSASFDTSGLAGTDLRLWCERVTASLPSGDAAIGVARDGNASISVAWDPRTAATGGQPPGTTAQDTETTLRIRL